MNSFLILFSRKKAGHLLPLCGELLHYMSHASGVKSLKPDFSKIPAHSFQLIWVTSSCYDSDSNI